MPPDNSNYEIKKLILENQRLLVENNLLLRKMRRSAIITSIFRTIWFLILIGGPIAFYYYYVAPNLEAISGRISELEQASSSLNSMKGLLDNLNNRLR
jgi:hypothetical protein